MAIEFIESGGPKATKEYILTQAKRTFEPNSQLIESLKNDLLPASHIKMQHADNQRFDRWLMRDISSFEAMGWQQS